jgi:hypothetical protein
MVTPFFVCRGRTDPIDNKIRCTLMLQPRENRHVHICNCKVNASPRVLPPYPVTATTSSYLATPSSILRIACVLSDLQRPAPLLISRTSLPWPAHAS